jgi:hypothetical protein
MAVGSAIAPLNLNPHDVNDAERSQILMQSVANGIRGQPGMGALGGGS